MLKLEAVSDAAACRGLWQRCIPQEHITDLWEVRECFWGPYRTAPLFLTVQDNDNQIVGFLPLCFVEEHNYYGYFPGERWHGTTWLEQNRIIARDEAVYQMLMDYLRQENISYHLRYLLPNEPPEASRQVVDEIGYLFRPADHGHDMNAYYERFSRKSIKSILKEVRRFEERGLEYRLDDVRDFDLLVEMNVSRFGQHSYFSDSRFAAGMRALVDLLKAKGWLRVVTVLIEGQPAAVDIGSVYNNAYTLLAGGTHAGYQGIAKVINLYHMKCACEERFAEADFLCGDFLWKPMFNLHPRPLYLLSNRPDLAHKE